MNNYNISPSPTVSEHPKKKVKLNTYWLYLKCIDDNGIRFTLYMSDKYLLHSGIINDTLSNRKKNKKISKFLKHLNIYCKNEFLFFDGHCYLDKHDNNKLILSVQQINNQP